MTSLFDLSDCISVRIFIVIPCPAGKQYAQIYYLVTFW